MTIYSVSDAYKTAIRARTRTDRVTGTLTLTNGTVLNLDAADLMSGSLALDNQCVTGRSWPLAAPTSARRRSTCAPT